MQAPILEQTIRWCPFRPRADAKAAEEARARKTLADAEAKLTELERTGDAPKSLADLAYQRGPTPQTPEEIAAAAISSVPAVLQTAPLYIGGFALVLFLLNSFGAFGAGPDLDKFAEDLAKL